jgi:hypothetical protein
MLKDSGGGIAPAAIAGLIEAPPRSVNAFSLPGARRGVGQKADKALMRLNFPRCAGNGWPRHGGWEVRVTGAAHCLNQSHTGFNVLPVSFSIP